MNSDGVLRGLKMGDGQNNRLRRLGIGLICLGGIVVALIAIGMFYRSHLDAVAQEAVAKNTAQLLAGSASREASRSFGVIETIIASASSAFASGAKDLSESTGSEATVDLAAVIDITDQSGRVVASSLASHLDREYGGSVWFRQASLFPENTLRVLRLEVLSDQRRMIVVQPRPKAGGEPQGLILVSVDPSEVVATLRSPVPPGDPKYELIDDADIVRVIRTVDGVSAGNYVAAEALKSAHAGGDGTSIVLGLMDGDDSPRDWAISDVGVGKMWLAVGVMEEKVGVDGLSDRPLFWSAAGILVLILGVLSWWLWSELRSNADTQALLLTVAEAMPVGLYIKSSNGLVSFINSLHPALAYSTRDAIIGKTARDFWPKPIAEIIRRLDIAALSDTSRVSEGEIGLNLGGRESRFEVRVKGVQLEAEDVVVGALIDVTDSRDKERQIEESERHLRDLIESTIHGVVVYTADLILFSSNEFGRMLAGGANVRADELLELWLGETGFAPYRRVEEVHEDQTYHEKSGRTLVGTELVLEIESRRVVWRGVDAIRSIVVNVTVAHQASRELQSEKAKAEEALETKSRFLALMSHNIQTPLTGIEGMIRQLSTTKLSKDQRQSVEIASRSARDLGRVLKDVIELSRLQSGTLAIERSKVDCSSVVRSIVAEFEPQARRKGVRLVGSVSAGVPRRLVTDNERLRQVVASLVSNAIKFTTEGSIQVSVSAATGGGVEFSVSDTGIGIDLKSSERLFEPFEQGDSSLTRRFDGAGMGLTIVQEVVRALGGHVRVESEAGAGARFSFVIMPLPEPEVRQEAVSEPNVVPVEPLDILVVDDSHTNLQVTEKILQTAGYRVATAGNGETGVALAMTGRFQVILMDLRMPVMDGFKALDRIRAVGSPVSTIPVIALSADSMEEERVGNRAEWDGFIPKPPDRDKMLKKIAEAVRRRRTISAAE